MATLSGWDAGLLAAEIGELAGFEALMGFVPADIESLATGGQDGRPLPTPEEGRRTLAERFGLPPFSVLNAREGWWQDRKRAWLSLGIQSELGRGENLLKMSDTVQEFMEHRKPALKGNGRPAGQFLREDLMKGEGKMNRKTADGSLGAIAPTRKQYTGKGGDLPGPRGPKRKAATP